MPISRWAVTLLSSVLLAFAATQAPTSHPDFSGTWKQSNERSQLPRRTSTTSYGNKIAWHDPDLHVTTMTENSRGEFAYSRVFIVDGKPHAGHNRNGDDKQTVVRWDGDALVFEVTEGDRQTVETWRLSEGGRVLIKTLVKGGAEQKFVLEKQ